MPAATPPSTAPPPRAAPDRTLLGIVFMCIAGSLFPVMNGVVQILSPRYASEQIVWARAASHLVFVLALFLPRYGVSLLRTTQLKWQVLRSAILLMSTLMFFTGVQYLVLAKAASISFTTPFIVAVLAWPLLGERVRMNRMIAVAVALIGVLIVIQPGSELFQWASLLILGNSFCYAFYQILTRHVAGHDSPETSAVYAATVSTLIMTVVLPFVWTAPMSWGDAALMFSLGILGGLGHYCVARAMLYAPANIVAPFQYWQMVGSVIVGYAISGLLPELSTWIGAAVIISAGLYIVWSATRKRTAA